MSEIAELLAALIGFLDSDDAFGQADPRTQRARLRLHGVARRALVELQPPPGMLLQFAERLAQREGNRYAPATALKDR